MNLLRLAAPALLAFPAMAQPVLYAVRTNGDLLWLNSISGGIQFIGSSGAPASAAVAVTFSGARGPDMDCMYTCGPSNPDLLNSVRRSTGTLIASVTLTGRPAGYAVRALAVSPATVFPSGTLYAILHASGPAVPDLFASISASAFTIIGATNRTDLISLAVSRAGQIYAVGSADGGNLFQLDAATGAATLIGGGALAGTRGLTFVPDGRLLVAGPTLLRIDPATGQGTSLGPTGYADICGIGAFFGCYPNCDTGGPAPILNVNDFACFLNAFASGSPYTNCDESSLQPVLNVNDFQCFLNRFTAGCQ